MNSASTHLVLFVCVENTFRSIIAEAIFNVHAPQGWRARSVGVRPGEKINPVTIQLLGEIGIEVAQRRPRLVTSDLVIEASKIVPFSCLDRRPIGARESEDWPIPGSTGKDGLLRRREELLAIRGEIERRVLRLIHELRRTVEPNTS